MNKSNVWLITAKTNLHVGDENASSYGLIDKAVQRDSLTDLPCINSSSLKGAINEYCCYGNDGKEVVGEKERKIIFGCDKVVKGGETSKGTYIFFDAKILLLPVPDDNSLFKYLTSERVLRQFFNQISMFKINDVPSDSTLFLSYLEKELDLKNAIDVEPYEVFKEQCSDDNLPIIARNHLENGVSKTLWYEQILPPETVLYTFIDPRNDSEDKLERLNKEIIQVGANATIGYGCCKFKHLNTSGHER